MARKSRFLRVPVEPFQVERGLSGDEVLARMERVSFRGRNLATARRIWEKMLVSALHTSAREALATRKPLRFDLSGPVMAVDGRPFPQARFEARE